MRRSFLTLSLVISFLLSLGQTKLDQLDAYFGKALQDWEVPGMSIGIIVNGELAWVKGYGVLEAGKAEKVDGKTQFAIASNSKAFTATALGMLVEAGKISWDDPVKMYLPDFELYDPWISHHMTIRDLLCHRVGFINFSGDVIWYKSERSAADLLDQLKYVPKAAEFRTEYGYSNLMFMTAGEVIRVVTGKDWHTYVKETFFDPIGMKRTVTKTSQLKSGDNVATPHKPQDGKNLPIAWTNWDNMGSAGSIISSAEDMLSWLQLHLEHGKLKGETLFAEGTQEEMWKPHNALKVNTLQRKIYPRTFAAYGLGWHMFDHEGHKVITHGGGYDGMYSRVGMVPDQGLGYVILTNSMKGISSYLAYKILDTFLEGGNKDWSQMGLARQKQGDANRVERVAKRKAARVSGTQPLSKEADMLGTYQDELYGAAIRIEKNAQGELMLHFDQAPALSARLTHWHYNTFQINWLETHAWFDFGTMQFVTDHQHRITGLEFDVPNDDIFFHEIHAKKVP
ncbi:MAG: serine hydrolase [Bacteroidota bacterium]